MKKPCRNLSRVLIPKNLKLAALMTVAGAVLVSCSPARTSRSSFVQQPGDRFDLLIADGIVIDGTGAPGRRADVLITGDAIAYIGELDRSRLAVERVVDARGKYVTPGFIDAHSHGDPFATPAFENFLAMGVTTISLGQDGSNPGRGEVAAWMSRVDELDLGPNIVLYVGHGTARRLAGVGLSRNPGDEQLQEMVDLVEKAMAAGCFGLSTGLEYQPGSFADLDELVALARPVGAYGGLVMSHMRSEDDDVIEKSLDELLAQGEGGGCAVHVSHIKVVYGHGKERAEQILARMQDGRQRGVHVTADIYPYTASFTGISIVFPQWAMPPHDYAEVVAGRRDELAKYLRERVMKRNGPEATLFASRPWSGKTLAQVADELGKPFEYVLIDDIGPGGASAAYFVIDPQLQERLLIDPHIMISTDGSPTMRHPRGYGTFARIIREYVVERRLLSLEEAVHKMTGLTAETIGLDRQKRGLLAPGFAADILIFDPTCVRDTATFEEPHQFALGFDWVIVNGKIVREEGGFTGVAAGCMLRHR